MSSFKNQSFASRYGEMGDEAEKIAVAVYPHKIHPFGFNRPDIYMGHMPAFVRCQPDFICNAHYLEVQGCGRSGKSALKIEKVGALTEWAEKWNLKWFIWHRTQRRWAVIDHGFIKDWTINEIDQGRVQVFWDNQKPYVELDIEAIDYQLWTYLDDPGSGISPGDNPDAQT